MSKLVSESVVSVESVDSPRGAVGGGTVGRDSLANRRIARWARGVLEGEADRFLFAILERGVLHRIDRRQVKEDLQNVCLPVGWVGDHVVRALPSRPHFCCLHSSCSN